MKRYRLLFRGVWDNDSQEQVLPGDPRWKIYQQWLADNVPDPVEPPPPPPPPSPEQIAREAEHAEREAISTELRADAAIQALRTRTPAQVNAWIDSSVTDLASARQVLKTMARILALLARERL